MAICLFTTRYWLPVRVHGAYVADEEVHRVVAAWQTCGKPDYLEK